jgi:hypothetical protein
MPDLIAFLVGVHSSKPVINGEGHIRSCTGFLFGKMKKC